MTFVPDFNTTETSIYPSPMSSQRDTESPQPASDPKAAATTAKPPAKRKRENRYKNAPPSVLSVSFFTLSPARIPRARRRASERAGEQQTSGAARLTRAPPSPRSAAEHRTEHHNGHIESARTSASRTSRSCFPSRSRRTTPSARPTRHYTPSTSSSGAFRRGHTRCRDITRRPPHRHQ